jgi:hypothetical protein
MAPDTLNVLYVVYAEYHKLAFCANNCYVKCCYAECHYADCLGAVQDVLNMYIVYAK